MKLIDRLFQELRAAPFKWSFVCSFLLLGWAWLLTILAQTKPALGGIAVCLAAPYLTWAFLPTQAIKLIDIALLPGVLPTPTLPGLQGSHFTARGMVGELVGSVLLLIVAGFLYGLLARFLGPAFGGRQRAFKFMTVAQFLAGLLTGFYLLTEHLLDAYGRTPVLAFLSNIIKGILYVPLRLVLVMAGEEPTLRRWGDFDLDLLLINSGLLGTIVALVLITFLWLVARYGRGRRTASSVGLQGVGN